MGLIRKIFCVKGSCFQGCPEGRYFFGTAVEGAEVLHEHHEQQDQVAGMGLVYAGTGPQAPGLLCEQDPGAQWRPG